MQRYSVKKQSVGSSLVDFLASTRDCSLRKAKALLDARCVFVNGRRVWMAKHRLKQGDVVEVHEAHVTPARKQLEIEVLWQNADYIVANKPPRILSNGANSVETRLNDTRCYNFSVHSQDNTEVAPPVHAKQNQLLQKHSGGTCSVTSSENRPKSTGNGYETGSSRAGKVRAVHRLDRDTTGCLCLAKSANAFDLMVEQFRAGNITKVYEAVVHGVLERGLSIAKPIDDLPATTHVQVLRVGRDVSHLRVRIDTGRTHQIRKHLAQIGHPIVGDRQYCTMKLTDQRFRQVPRQLLHASSFAAPIGDGNQPVTVKAPLPSDFVNALKRLGLR